MPPRSKTVLSKLAQYRLALPDRPSQGWVADKVSELAGDDVSQQAVGYWETGKVDLRKVHPRRLAAYASVLRISSADLAEAIGYEVKDLFPDLNFDPAPDPLADFPAPLYKKRDEVYMPEGLLDAIKLFGDVPEYSDLKHPDVQRQLANHRGFDGGPQTAGQWLAFFQANKPWITSKD